MKWIKIAGAVVGVFVIVLVILAAYGIPVRGLIESNSRDMLAKQGLKLDIGGNAQFVVWPQTAVVIEQAQLRDAESGDDLVTVDRIRADLSLSDLLSGRVHINELALTRPVVQTDPMYDRARQTAETPGRSAAAGETLPVILPIDSDIAIDTISAENGTVWLKDGARKVELSIDSLRLAAMPAADGRSNVHLDARLGSTNVRLTAGVDSPVDLTENKPVPIDATIEAPTILKTPATITATLIRSGPVLKLDSLNGAIDHGRVRGTMSVSFAAAKPFIDATLESERLDFTSLVDTITDTDDAAPTPAATRPPAPNRTAAADRAAAWSDKPLNLFGLRLIEGNLNLTAREVLVREVRIAPATAEATLLEDILTLKLTPSGVYGGQATGEMVVDNERDDPRFTLQFAFSALDALPFLRDAVGFENLSGRGRGAVDLRAKGKSPLEIVSALNGRAEFRFEHGAVRGLDMPDMVRSLVDVVLNGWQANASEETRFSQFDATFVVEDGIASSTDVRFTGPFVEMTAAGRADLRAKTLDFRADPRLVSGRQGTDDAQAAPWSIGVPVVIKGPWAEPRIYAEVPNILADPEDALRALRDQLSSGTPDGNSDQSSPLGGFIEELSKKLGNGDGNGSDDPAQDGGGIVDEMLKTLGVTRGLAVPQPETTAPSPQAAPPPAATQRSDPSPDPGRELERGAREFLRDLLNR